MIKNILRFFSSGQDASPIEDSQQVDCLYKKCRLSILMSITIGYGFYYTCRLALSVVKKPLIDNGIFTVEELGTIGSAIFYGYAFGKLANGFLADHANVRKLFSTGLLLSALVNLLVGVFPIYWLIVALWGLNGWFQAFGAPSSIISLSNWFSNRERGQYYGIWSSSHSIGEGITFVLTAALVSCWGWRAGFVGPGIMAIVVAFLLYAFMRDRPRTVGLPPVADWKNDHGVPVQDAGTAAGDEHRRKISLQLSVLKRPALWVLALASASMYINRYAVNSWGILYLQEAKGYSLIEAGSVLGLNTIAGILGCIAYGFISDKLFNSRRPPVTLIFGLIQFISLCIIFLSPFSGKMILTISFMVYGFTLSGLLAVIGGLFAVDIMPKQVSGAVCGFIGISSYLGAALQENISSYLIAGGVEIIDGVKHYDFSQAVIFWISSSVISMILAATLWKIKAAD